MPIYEYYCKQCDGVFEALRPMRESSEPVPCPVCDRDGKRIISHDFAAFTYRDGYPRRIPDRGTYWHLGKEVSKPVTGGVRAWEHPEVDKPTPPPAKSKGDLDVEGEQKHLEAKREKRRRKEGIRVVKGP